MAARVERALRQAEAKRELGAFWVLGTGSGGAERRSAELAGMPFAVKDMIDQAGLPTSAGLPGPHQPAAADAEAVARLRGAGAVPIGKTAMDQLGASTSGQAIGFPPCHNPRDRALSPGGSSSGSAVAVAAGIVPLALGTDTAGSVRIPASYCGVVGLKPGRTAIPRDGVLPVMPGNDAVGLLGASVEVCAAALRVLTGAATPRPGSDVALRVGLLADLCDQAEAPVTAGCRRALGAAAATEVEEAAIGWAGEGFGTVLATELAETWGERVERDPERFSELIRETVAFGRRAAGEPGRETVLQLRDGAWRAAARLARFDAVACPTTPTPAPARAREDVAVSTRFTRLFNALDWAAISLPVPPPAGCAPFGIQLAAPPSQLGALLELARRVETGLADPD